VTVNRIKKNKDNVTPHLIFSPPVKSSHS